MRSLDINADVTKGPDGRAVVSASGTRQIRAHLDLAVRHLDAGESVTLRFRQGPKLRSGAQNRLYRGPFLGAISLGYLDAGRSMPPDVLHRYYKPLYLPLVAAEVERETGEVLDVERWYEMPDGRSTRTLTTTQLTPGAFSLYLEMIASDDDVAALGIDLSGVLSEARGVRSGRIAESEDERTMDYSPLSDEPFVETVAEGGGPVAVAPRTMASLYDGLTPDDFNTQTPRRS